MHLKLLLILNLFFFRLHEADPSVYFRPQKPEQMNTDLSVISESSTSLKAAKLSDGVFQSADVARQQTQFHSVGRIFG